MQGRNMSCSGIVVVLLVCVVHCFAVSACLHVPDQVVQ
jgi:hypothetical protein